MTIYNNDLFGTAFSGYIEVQRELIDLENAIIVAARDGDSIDLLKAFAVGNFDGALEERVDTIMRAVLYTAYMNEHNSVIKAIFNVRPSSFNSYNKNFIGYDHVANLHAQILEGEGGKL